MPANYLLPCACGHRTRVDANQAGLTVRCACGTELTVPAMRGLAALERADLPPAAERTAPAGPTWGRRQGLIFLGSVILIAGALAAVAIWFFLIPSPLSLKENYRQATRDALDSMPVEDLIAKWNEYRNGVEQETWEQAINMYEAVVRGWMQWVMLAGGIGCVGLLLIVIGLLMPAKAASHGR